MMIGNNPDAGVLVYFLAISEWPYPMVGHAVCVNADGAASDFLRPLGLPGVMLGHVGPPEISVFL
jgi:hypothetical protein